MESQTNLKVLSGENTLNLENTKLSIFFIILKNEKTSVNLNNLYAV